MQGERTTNQDLQLPRVSVACPAGIRAMQRLVWERGWRRVCVLGSSKNAGKTTTLNALAAAAGQMGERVGLCSMGLDGEAFDAWLDCPKPRVQVEKGTLLVTAAAMAQQAGPLLRLLKPAGFRSALGETVLCEARAPGGVQLCGVPHRAHLGATVELLRAAGADRVLVDGAYHRQAAAHGDVADALVVAVGAVLGADPQAIAEAAAPTLAALATQAWDGEMQGMLEVPGGLSDAWLQRQSLAGVRCLLVEGPSRVLLGPAAWSELRRRAIRVAARRPLPVCAVTTSTFRPDGAPEDPLALQRAVAEVLQRWSLPSLAIVDVVSGMLLGEVP